MLIVGGGTKTYALGSQVDYSTARFRGCEAMEKRICIRNEMKEEKGHTVESSSQRLDRAPLRSETRSPPARMASGFNMESRRNGNLMVQSLR